MLARILFFSKWHFRAISHPRRWGSLPTHARLLNQVECWFSILSRRALRGASFTSAQQVRDAIDRFIAAYNDSISK